MLALFISMLSYIIFVVFAGAAAVRDASGNITDVINGTVIPCTSDCQWGLFNSYSVSAPFLNLNRSFTDYFYANGYSHIYVGFDLTDIRAISIKLSDPLSHVIH